MASEKPAKDGQVEVLHGAVEAFRQREITYRDILEDLPTAIYTVDDEGRITYCNRACTELSGRQPVLGEDRWCVAAKLYAPDGLPLPHSESATAIAVREKRPVRGLELVGEQPDGTRFTFLSHAMPILGVGGECVGAVDMMLDITEQKLTQERTLLLAREADHRSTNLLTVVQSLVRLTKSDSRDAYREALESRITALARANRLVADARWKNVTLRSLAEVELAAFSERQISISGDTIELSPQSAQALGMLVHELCTNAVKYGALSVETGTVSLSWAADDQGVLMLQWQEHGAPALQKPVRNSIGNAVILGAVRQLRGEIFREWHQDGLRCTFLCNIARL